MGKKFDIDVSLNGKDNGASSAVDKLAQKINILKKEQRASGENALEGALKSPTSMADTLGDLVGVGKVGIAAVVLDKMGEAIGNVAQSMGQVREGKATWGDFGETMLRNVPIVGKLIGGLRDLRFELDGSNAAEEKTARNMERASHQAGEQQKRLLQLNAALKQIKETQERGAEGLLVNLLGNNDYDKRRMTNDQDLEHQLKDLAEQKKKAAGMDSRSANAEYKKIFDLENEAHRQHDEKERNIDLEQGDARVKTNKDHERELTDLQEEHAGARLELQGKTLAAQLQQLEYGKNKQLRTLAEQFEEEQRLYGFDENADANYQQRKDAIEAQANDKRQELRKNALEELAKMKVEAQKDAAEEQIDTLEKQKGPGKAGFEATLVSSRFQGINSQQSAAYAVGERQRQMQIELLRQMVKSMERQERERERGLKSISLGAI